MKFLARMIICSNDKSIGVRCVGKVSELAFHNKTFSFDNMRSNLIKTIEFKDDLILI